MRTTTLRHRAALGAAIAAIVCLLGILGVCHSPGAWAVTGGQVAADGTYSTSIVAYKSGKASKTATVNVVVVDGQIADLTFSGSDAKDFKKYLMGEKGTEGMFYLDKTASANAVDAVSSATQGSGKYTIDLKSAIKAALENADEREGGSTGQTCSDESLADGTYTKDYTAGDGRYTATVTVTVSDGKISNIVVDNNGSGDWSTPLSDAKSNLIGKTTAAGVDVISSATQYSQALEDAILAALCGEKQTEEPVVETYSAPVVATKTKDGKTKTSTVNVTVSNGKVSRISFSGGDADDFEKYLKTAKTGSDKYNMSWYEALVGKEVDESLLVDATSSASLKNETTSSKYGTNLQQALLEALAPLLSGTDPVDPDPDPDSDTASVVVVKKKWSDGAAAHKGDTVVAGIYDASGTKVQDVMLNAGNSWEQTITGLDASGGYIVREESATNKAGDDISGDYDTEVTVEESTVTTQGGWQVVALGAVEDGKTYAFTYESNGTTYLLGRSGTSVTGSTSGLAGNAPSAGIGDDFQWTVGAAGSGASYGPWTMKNNGNGSYLALVSSYSTGYTPSATVSSSSFSYYSGMNLHFDDDGSIWAGYTGYNMLASGSSVGANGSNWTVFTPYEYTGVSTTTKTATFTIANTLDESVEHHKSVEKTDDNEYTIKLDVTGKEITRTAATPGQGTTESEPANILLVLDNTTSMGQPFGSDTRLAAMKDAAKAFVNGLPENADSRIAMMSFVIGNYESPTTTDQMWTALDSAGKGAVISKVNALSAPDVQNGYDTNFVTPLNYAADYLDSAPAGNKTYVVVFTDGSDGNSLSTVQAAAAAVHAKADATFSIGITNGSSEEQKAQVMASDSSYYYSVADASQMAGAFSAALGLIVDETVSSTETVSMQDVVVKDTLSDNVEKNGDITVTDSAGNTLAAGDDYTIAENGKTITVAINKATKGTTYTVNIPVKVAQTTKDDFKNNKGADEANYPDTSDTGAKGYYSNDNDNVTLTYRYGADGDAVTVPYEEKPVVQVVPDPDPTYTVTYTDGVNGEAFEDQATGDLASGVDTPAFNGTPSREGYTFKGWSPDVAPTVAGDATYTATWEKNTGTATKHGSASVAKTGEDGEGLSGATFALKDGSDEIAAYEASPTFAINTQDAALADYLPAAGEERALVLVEKAAPEGYVLAADSHAVKISATEDEELVDGVYVTTTTYAITIDGASSKTIENAKKTYTVTFVDEDGTVVETQTVKHGEMPTAPEDPAKDATDEYTYSFGGWTPQVVPATADVTYKATYTGTKNKYPVTFVDEDGKTVLKGPDDYEYGTVPSFGKDEPTKEPDDTHTYTFAGWDRELEPVTGAATYKATYAPKVKTYNVKWVDDDGAEIDSQAGVPVTDDPKDHPKDPAKGSTAEFTYTFAGWDKSVDPKTGDVTYTAKYNASTRSYAVKWMNEDGSELSSESYEYGATPVYSGNAPSKAEDENNTYAFDGWDKEIEPVTGNAVYTATYKAIPKERPSDPDPDPNKDPDPMPDPDPDPDPTPDPDPDPEPEPTPEPNPMPNPDPSPDPEPTPTPVPTPDPEPTPMPVPTPDPEPDPTPEPNEDPEPDPTPEPDPDPEPNPAEDPQDNPIQEDPKDDSAEEPADDPADNPADDPAEEPVIDPVQDDPQPADNTNGAITVSWVDENGNRITSIVADNAEGDFAFSGKTPTKDEDEEYTYEFIDWKKTVDSNGNVIYTPEFRAVPKAVVDNPSGSNDSTATGQSEEERTSSTSSTSNVSNKPSTPSTPSTLPTTPTATATTASTAVSPQAAAQTSATSSTPRTADTSRPLASVAMLLVAAFAGIVSQRRMRRNRA